MSGQELKERRLEFGLTQLGLSHLLGVRVDKVFSGKAADDLFQKK